MPELTRRKAFEALHLYTRAEDDWRGNITCENFAKKYGLNKPRHISDIISWLDDQRKHALAMAKIAADEDASATNTGPGKEAASE